MLTGGTSISPPFRHCLYLKSLRGHVALALEDIAGEIVAEALPSLDLVCLAGQLASSIEKFVAARKLSGQPVTVVNEGSMIKAYVNR
jgi:hypothetical protein